jgi:hypothetical protein
VDALADANNAWWSVSSWQDRGVMVAFVGNRPHRSIMDRLDSYCDEATFVDWEQDSPELPDWQTSHRHLVADGQAAELTHPSDANQTRAFPPPVVPAGPRYPPQLSDHAAVRRASLRRSRGRPASWFAPG